MISEFYHFKVWRSQSGTPIGQSLSISEYQTHVKQGWHIISFPGHRGVVITLIEDMTITRLECLGFAIAFMEGRMIEIHVDLNKCTATTTNVTPPP